MRKIELGKSGLMVPTVAIGCMRISNMNEKEASAFLDTAIDNGANYFDHADIYGGGQSEVVFGKAMQAFRREDLLIQTKCGIVPGKMFDFSYEHIINSVNGSLKRLNTDYVDVLLLHRPDALMEPEEVAKAFDKLKSSGKVRHFGVSNQNPYQMQLLQSALDMPLVANQLQFGIMHSSMVQSGINVNMYNESATNRDGGVLDFCRLNKITIQPWSPMQYGFFEGVFVDNEKFPKLNETLARLSEKYGVSKTTLAIAWILRHPAKMQPVTGTTNPGRLAECLKAAEVTLSREDWYDIYMSAGNVLP
ncbi:MAG: aldo/keto reductase [Clostridia bacterium]|nr:aldo/keto reductase family oxidoreductase [Oscillospiraceae bacterium]MBQ4624088.1 aldo/keto reductase [Clostridia bacterium]MBQ6990268.1 aldo/keto reductase [Clostridia bacterium]